VFMEKLAETVLERRWLKTEHAIFALTAEPQQVAVKKKETRGKPRVFLHGKKLLRLSFLWYAFLCEREGDCG